MSISKSPEWTVPKIFWILGLVALGFILLPIISLVAKTDFFRLIPDISKPEVLTALRVSLTSSLVLAVLAFAFGTPLAYLMAFGPRKLSNVIRPIVISALVFPPTVAGLALIAFLGTESLIGKFLDQRFGFEFSGSFIGVVFAGLFVGAPFLVLVAESSFIQLDKHLVDSGRTEGASAWQIVRFITTPQVLPSILAGMALTWARAIGEFGATMTFAGSYVGKTLTPSMKIYEDLKTDIPAAYSLSTLMLVISIFVILTLQGFWKPIFKGKK